MNDDEDNEINQFERLIKQELMGYFRNFSEIKVLFEGGRRITNGAQRELETASVQAVAKVVWNLDERWPRLARSGSGQGGVLSQCYMSTSTTSATLLFTATPCTIDTERQQRNHDSDDVFTWPCT